jgi:coatomer subunit beta'
MNRLNYYVGGEIVTVSHLDRVMYLLGYIPKDNSLYLCDKELNVVSYSLPLSVLEYQTAVMRRDFETADKVLPGIPKDQRTRVAHFLEKQGFKQQALAVSSDLDHRFDLALQIGDLNVAKEIAEESESEQKWKQLGELAISKCEFDLAQEALHKAQDLGGLLLIATAAGNATMVDKLAESALQNGKNNISFTSYFLLGNLEKCLDILISTERLPEAAFFARTYLPSQVPRIISLWKDSLAKVSEKAAQSLADPVQYENLFPEYELTLRAEEFMRDERKFPVPANEYTNRPTLQERNPIEEMKHSGSGDSRKFNHTIPDRHEEKLFMPPVQAQESRNAVIPPKKTETIDQEFLDEDDDLELQLDGIKLTDADNDDIDLDDDIGLDDD